MSSRAISVVARKEATLFVAVFRGCGRDDPRVVNGFTSAACLLKHGALPRGIHRYKTSASSGLRIDWNDTVGVIAARYHTAMISRSSIFYFILCLMVIPVVPAVAAQISPAALDDIRNGKAGIEAAGIVIAMADAQGRLTTMAVGCARFDDAANGQRCASPLRPDSVMRVASLAKLLIAAQLHRRALSGAIDLEQDAGQYLSPLLRHPKFPERNITVRQLLTHTASLRDSGDDDEAHAPGTYFRYANANYIALVQLIERVSGQRFDRVIGQRELRGSYGSYGGFDWSLASTIAPSRIATLYRKQDAQGRWQPGGPWRAQTDDFMGKAPDAVPLRNYRLGEDTASLTPAGGLRASLPALVTWLSRLDTNVWDAMRTSPYIVRADGVNGDSFGGSIQAIGAGAHAFHWSGVGQVWGHFGAAYGLRAALLREPLSRRTWAYAITGYGGDPDIGPRGVHGLDPVQEAVLALLSTASQQR